MACTADLAVFAKAIAGGIALSAVTGSRAVMAPIADGRLVHNGTFNGNPIAMASGVATLSHLVDGRDADLSAELDRLGAAAGRRPRGRIAPADGAPGRADRAHGRRRTR